MKKTIKVVSLILSLLLIFVSGSGCVKHKGEDHMKRYMNSIELEYPGYYISDKQEDGSIVIIGMQLPADIIIKEKNISIDVLETEEQSFKGYTVSIDKQEIEITVDYFKSQSVAFNKIIKMWDGYEDEIKQPQNINIGCMFVFDDELFMCASYRPSQWLVDWRGQIPLTLYHFDINDFSLKYAGWFDSYTFNGYIVKNK